MPEVRLIGIAGGFIELRSKDILVSQFIKREPDATNTRKQVYETPAYNWIVKEY